MTETDDSTGIGLGTRRRVAWRILPFVFALYLIAYIDRANVSFANLRMSADLGFTDAVYGLGVGVFFIGYGLFEIPGALIVERWSARKWIARIMISWGIISILMGFVQSAGQFYVVRFLLGASEASFFPGMIVYLTHWFRARDRSRAIACLYTAVPAASLVSSPLAGWLLGVRWLGLVGWRWLPEKEREWLLGALAAETQAKKKAKNFTIWGAFRDPRVLLLTLAWFFALCGSLGSLYWIPTFVKRLSGASVRAVTTMIILPSLIGIVGMLWNGWHSDKTGERRWHAAVPLFLAGSLFGMSILARGSASLAVWFVLLGSGCYYAFQPVCWALPTLLLGESAATATFGLINSVGQLGGLVGPKMVGFLNMRTQGLTASLGFIAGAYLVAGALMLSLKIHDPLVVQASGERS